ncbi:hypothetical protein PYCC9005_003226 [Savitreella phatthalungensis]
MGVGEKIKNAFKFPEEQDPQTSQPGSATQTLPADGSNTHTSMFVQHGDPSMGKRCGDSQCHGNTDTNIHFLHHRRKGESRN